MTERIRITDPVLADRVERAMEQLLSFYPDKQVARLDSDHKKLGERLSALWQAGGYESRAAMLEAYGFAYSAAVGQTRHFVPPEDKLERAMEQLLSFYPDKQVARLDTDHKNLAARLSALWQASGYESRAAMLQAYGFDQVDMRAYASGRPTLDHEELLVELQRRYEGKPKPKKLGLLVYENPDLAGNLKTLTNKSNELFGRTLAKELAARGILDKKPTEPDIDDDVVKAFVDGLVATYVEVSDKPKTLEGLKKRHPEDVELIDVFRKRCDDIFGTTAADYLKKNGVLRAGARYVDAASVEVVLSEIEVASAGLPDGDKPLTITALALRHPEHAEVLKAGQVRGFFTKETLQRRGILRLSEKVVRTQREETVASSVRNATIRELASAYAKSGGESLLVPSSRPSPHLRPGVVGIDIGAGCELRVTTFNVADPSSHVDQDAKVSVSVGNLPADSDEISYRIAAPGMNAIDRIMDALDASFWIQVVADGIGTVRNIARKEPRGFLVRERFETESVLAEYAGAEIAAVADLSGVRVLQVRYRFLAPLTRSTLLYALREMGAISEQDLLGGDSWRNFLGAGDSALVDGEHPVDVSDGPRHVGQPAGAGDSRLRPGDAVVFTGLVNSQGDLDYLRSEATEHGLRVTTAVSGRTALLVAADPGSSDTVKAHAARERGIPVVDYPTYLNMLRTLRT